MSDILKEFSKAQAGLVTQQSDFSLKAIFDMIKQNSINVAPGYQRRDRWSLDKQSALIESFLLNVPVPPVYLSEDDYGTYSVIDGKQRLTAISEFLCGRLVLKNLSRFPDLNGKTFKDLPIPLQNALSVRPFVRVIILLQQSDPELKYEVFLRLNTGGEKLKPQEIRNVAYSGKLNDLLIKLSESFFLRKQMKIKNEKSTPYRNMDDVEMVLRFLSLEDKWEHYGKKLAHGMDDFMAKNRNSDTANYKKVFERSLDGCKALWGKNAFQKPVNGGWREQFIAPLYDAQMIVVSELTDDELGSLTQMSDSVIETTRDLFDMNPDFVKSVSQATSDSSAINTRVNILLNGVREMLINA
jgi:hypothetical protein